jgi:hypothetical protein
VKIILNYPKKGYHHNAFELSDMAIRECVKRGLIINKVDKSEYFVRLWFNNEKYYIVNEYKKSLRYNPIVIAVVQELGEKANGTSANLKVVNIPFEDENGWFFDNTCCGEVLYKSLGDYAILIDLPDKKGENK